MTSVVNLSRPHRKVRDRFVALGKVRGAARYFDKVVREIETDLGGKRILSRIERAVRIVQREVCLLSPMARRQSKESRAAIYLRRGFQPGPG